MARYPFRDRAIALPVSTTCAAELRLSFIPARDSAARFSSSVLRSSAAFRDLRAVWEKMGRAGGGFGMV